MSVFLEYSSAMKKIAFPRICLPLIVGGGALLNHVLLLFALAVVFLFFGHLPGGAWIALILGAFLIAALGFGLGILLGVFNVFARDVGYVFGIVLQFWFWLTPIVYTANVLPDRFQKVIAINPMTPLVQVYQDALLLNKWPAFETLIYPALLAAFLVGFAFFVFRQASAELVDAL
jgi:lipopolysaccharide transport system permease protein